MFLTTYFTSSRHLRSLLQFTLCVSLLLLPSCGSEVKWAKHSSKQGGFTVFMPSSPKIWEKREVTVFGKQITNYTTWRPSSFALAKFKLFEVSYTVSSTNIPSDSASVNRILDSAINLRKKDFTEAEIEAQPIDLNGYPGRAFIYDPPRGATVAIVKICLAGNKKYDLTVVAKKNYPTNEEINDFFNSFVVLNP